MTALGLRQLGFTPGSPVVDDLGRTLECVSYPFPDDPPGSFAILVRQPGHPCSIERARIPPEAVDLLPD